MKHLTIITPCTRPDNLPLLARSIEAGRRLFAVTWWIVFDGDWDKLIQDTPGGSYTACVKVPGSRFGNAQRNYALDKVSDGWVYFLDDDTILHPELFERMSRAIDETDKSAFCFPTTGGQNKFTAQACPENMKVNRVDLGQVFLTRALIGDHRFAPVGEYAADGHFIASIYNAAPDEWAFLDTPLALYNHLRR